MELMSIKPDIPWYSFYKMNSRYFDVSLKNGMWREIWICDITRILMIQKGNISKNEEIPRIATLTSRFHHSDLELDFFSDLDLHFFTRKS
jgi:hypothetical protein